MAKRYTPEENKLIETAIGFLVDEYRNSGHNPKPVMFHSLRVACRLTQHDADGSVVSAAILHDLVEDSSVTKNDIEDKFGNEIRKLVSAVSFKPTIEDKTRQYKEMFERIKQEGLAAMRIKCVDILDNSDYYALGNNEQSERVLLQKMNHFLTVTEPHLKGFPPYRKLTTTYKNLSREFSNQYGKDIDAD